MSDNTVLDTTIHEPPATADEVETMFFALDRVRSQFAWKVGGLDADGLRARLPPSTMTLAGLIKHLAQVEDSRVRDFLTGEPSGPWRWSDFEADMEWDWHSASDDTPDELYALWQGAVRRARTAWSAAVADGGLDRPSVFTTHTGEHPNLRRVLVDLIEEYLRHTGHADLLRENVDGLVGNDPPQP